MPASIYLSKSIEPNAYMLQEDLGETGPFLNEITSFIRNEYNELTLQWKFYGKKSGWLLKVLQRNRNLLFVIPRQGYFVTVFTFGDKSVERIFETEVSESIKHELSTAKKYAEGRTIQIDVKADTQLIDIIELIKIKMNS